MFPTGWLLALAGASLMSHVTGQADTPEMVFDCNVTPGICTNMCFGAYCRGYDVSLNYDKPSGATKAARRNKAGCKSGSNRCTGGGSPDPDGGSCDEYPFAATSNADDVQAVNRCVPNAEQHSQGGTTSSFYQHTLGNAPGEFIVGFGNPDNSATQYCEYGTECNNDGNEYCGDDLCPDGKASKMMHKRNYYMLESGMSFLSTRELTEESIVKRVVKRSEAEMTLRARGAGDPWELIDDKVRHRILRA